jgi:hypothetical protein
MHSKKDTFLSDSLLLRLFPSPKILVISVVAAIELGRPLFFAISVELGRSRSLLVARSHAPKKCLG